MGVITHADELMDIVSMKMLEVGTLMGDVMELVARIESPSTWGYNEVNQKYLRRVRKINRKIQNLNMENQ